MSFDPNGNRLIVADTNLRDVLAFSAVDGRGSVVSAANRSATPANSVLTALVVDPANNRAIAVDSPLDALVAIDLATGARTTLSIGNSTGATLLNSTTDLALDSANNRVFAMLMSARTIVAVNLTTGERSVISSPTKGTGPSFVSPVSIELDTTIGTHLYVGDGGGANPTIYEVEVDSGNRAVFSQSTVETCR